MAYLIVDPQSETYVFTDRDPRQEGFAGRVREDVSLREEFPEILRWPEGKRPDHWLGVSQQDETDYRIFPSTQDCTSAGFKPLTTRYWAGGSWEEWDKTRRPLPNK
jgi:hypothetical protein